MKKLLIGVLVLGSISSFACEWSVKKAHIDTYKRLASKISNVQIENWNDFTREEHLEMNSTERSLLFKTYDVIEGECELDTSLIADAELVLRKYSK